MDPFARDDPHYPSRDAAMESVSNIARLEQALMALQQRVTALETRLEQFLPKQEVKPAHG